MEAKAIEIGGLRVRWEEHGEGTSVVFIHGIPTGPRLWRHVTPRLSGCRTLAWEMGGYAGSIEQGRGRDISVARQAEYLVRWMDAIDLEQAVLVGHDLGGGVAQIAAVRHPERVQGLVLTNAICYDSWPIPSVKLLRALSPLLARAPDALVYLIMAVLFFRGHDDFERMKESLRVHWTPYASADATRALVRQIQALDVRDTLAVADRLPDLDVSARLVWGAADPFQKIRYGERLARALDAPLDRIDGGKHFVPEDHPDRVAAAVRAVVDEIRIPG